MFLRPRLLRIRRRRHRIIVFIVLSFILLNYFFIAYVIDSYTSYEIEDDFYIIPEYRPDPNRVVVYHPPYNISRQKLKYILEWTPLYTHALLKEGQASFLENKCQFNNCFLTTERKDFLETELFDAILFSPHKSSLNVSDLPSIRSTRQKYVFVSVEPASKVMVFNPLFDNFFNWTWTYKLDSDVQFKYITMYNTSGEEIGPRCDMVWPGKMKPIEAKLKRQLRTKKRAAAWVLTHDCQIMRLRFAKLETEMKKYGFGVDIYGECGMESPSCRFYRNHSACYKMLEKDYFFYFSFELAVDEDFVTAQLLLALNNFVVPVVFGGANYSRFLPHGSYINARELGPAKTAKTMVDLMKNFTAYCDYFRWRNYYTYNMTLSTKELCNICTALNDVKKLKTRTMYQEFRSWWNGKRWTNLYDKIKENNMSTADLVMTLVEDFS